MSNIIFNALHIVNINPMVTGDSTVANSPRVFLVQFLQLGKDFILNFFIAAGSFLVHVSMKKNVRFVEQSSY